MSDESDDYELRLLRRAEEVLRADLTAEIRKLTDERSFLTIGKLSAAYRDGWNAAIEAAAKIAEGEK